MAGSEPTPPIQRFTTLLRTEWAKLDARHQSDLDTEDVLDILWLAHHIRPAAVQEVSQDQKIDAVVVTHQMQERIAPPPPSDREPKASVYTSPAQAESSADTQPGLGTGLPLQVPAANALQSQLDLARALRPLMRKIPSPTQRSLDEEATAIQIAEQEIWSPVLVNAPERWFDLAIVVEDSPSLKLWEDTIAEFKTLVEQQGAFRQIRTWGLQGKAGRGIQLFSNWRPGIATIQSSAEVARNVLQQLGGDNPTLSEPLRPASTLLDPTGRRIIWLVSDCTSDLWDSPPIYKWVEKWGKYSPLAIVQLFPERLWSRTALEVGHPVRLYAMTPDATQARLSARAMPIYPVPEEETQAEISDQETEGNSEGKQAKSIILPVISLEPEPINRWSKVTVGMGGASVAGLQISLHDLTPQPGSSEQTRNLAPEQRVQQFCATASITAQKLAGLMAAVPVSLPVAHLIQKTLLPQSRQVHLAEVFMGGLLDTTPSQSVFPFKPTQYYFPEPVREKLIDAVPISKTTQVLDTISAYICDRLGLGTKSFAALIASIPDLELVQQQEVQPFAEIGLNTLRRLGGDYRRKADQLAPFLNPSPPIDTPQSFPDLQILEFETAQLVDSTLIPPLQTQEVEVVTIVLDNESQTPVPYWQLLQFEVATIKPRKKPRQSKQRNDRQLIEELNRLKSKWVIRRQQRERVSLLIESLGAIDLEMVLIPSGKFMMGGYVNETGQSSSENPRHEVSVETFLISRYPVTQTQWHFVAGLDQVNRELDLNPSYFKGENRPVEQVSWYDAVEFCARLSTHTGREYQLPTEAEWEYACRAGTTTPFHFGETITTDLANYDGNSTYKDGPKGEYREETTPVDHFGIANAFGLCDMHGNVFEWCQDHWHENYEGAPIDGSAWLSENENADRVVRGGSWIDVPRLCRSAYRDYLPPADTDDDVGFRVVCSAPRT